VNVGDVSMIAPATSTAAAVAGAPGAEFERFDVGRALWPARTGQIGERVVIGRLRPALDAAESGTDRAREARDIAAERAPPPAGAHDGERLDQPPPPDLTAGFE
jgi:hypothetical protein